VDPGLGVDRLADEGAVLTPAGEDMVFRGREHAARPGTGVIDRDNGALAADAVFVAGQEQVGHEMDDVARGEVLARVLVQGFVELPDELLENSAHRGVVDLVGMLDLILWQTRS